MTGVWQQVRRVDVGPHRFTDLDMKIDVTMKGGKPKYDVRIWNLSEETWRDISTGDECRIMLGWEDGPIDNVIFGIVDKKSKTVDGRDIKFRFKGTDKTEQQIKQRASKTWDRGTRPTRVAKDIAGLMGMTAGSIEQTKWRMVRRFVITKDKTFRYWLDQLTKEAERASGEPWEWFTDTGKLFFVKPDGRKEEAVTLSFDNTLVSIGESEAKKTKQSSGLSFKAMCEPRIRQGAAVVVDTEEYSGAYKVTNYTFKSDTINGEHMVSGKLSPLDVEYSTTSNRYGA